MPKRWKKESSTSVLSVQLSKAGQNKDPKAGQPLLNYEQWLKETNFDKDLPIASSDNHLF